jgi:hypothetical protein
LVGRELTHNARPIITIQASPESDLIVPGAVARIQGKKVVKDVQNVKVLLYDSGAEHNEITFEVAQKLGLFDESVEKKQGPIIRTNTGEYQTLIAVLTLEIDHDVVQTFNKEKNWKDFLAPELVARNMEFLFPIQGVERPLCYLHLVLFACK